VYGTGGRKDKPATCHDTTAIALLEISSKKSQLVVARLQMPQRFTHHEKELAKSNEC
jgi:hypothetical protein